MLLGVVAKKYYYSFMSRIIFTFIRYHWPVQMYGHTVKIKEHADKLTGFRSQRGEIHSTRKSTFASNNCGPSIRESRQVTLRISKRGWFL